MMNGVIQFFIEVLSRSPLNGGYDMNQKKILGTALLCMLIVSAVNVLFRMNFLFAVATSIIGVVIAGQFDQVLELGRAYGELPLLLNVLPILAAIIISWVKNDPTNKKGGYIK
jgi:hypothetical protein